MYLTHHTSAHLDASLNHVCASSAREDSSGRGAGAAATPAPADSDHAPALAAAPQAEAPVPEAALLEAPLARSARAVTKAS